MSQNIAALKESKALQSEELVNKKGNQAGIPLQQNPNANQEIAPPPYVAPPNLPLPYPMPYMPQPWFYPPALPYMGPPYPQFYNGMYPSFSAANSKVQVARSAKVDHKTRPKIHTPKSQQPLARSQIQKQPPAQPHHLKGKHPQSSRVQKEQVNLNRAKQLSPVHTAQKYGTTQTPDAVPHIGKI